MPVTFHHPLSLAEVCELMDELDGAHLIAGGVSLAMMVREGFIDVEYLVSLQQVDGFSDVTRAGGVLRLGAGLTHDRLANSTSVKDALGCADVVFGGIGNSRVRNAGTLGGNLAHADPAQDPSLLLAAAGAVAEVSSVRADRDVAIAELATGAFETVLEPDEVITAVRVPAAPEGRQFGYCKLRPNSLDDYGTANAAVAIDPATEGSGPSLRVVVGAVVATPLVLDVADVDLDSIACREARLPTAIINGLATIKPQHDRRGNPEYKLALTQVAVRRALDAALRGNSRVAPGSHA